MFRLLILCAILSIMACAGSKAGVDPDKTTEVLVSFIKDAQAGFWKEAMDNVTPDERSDMMDGSQVMQEYKDAINRIRLSTVRNMDLSLDRKGRLVGLRDALDQSNELYKSSDEKVVIDPSKLEDLAALRQKQEEEAAKKALLEPPKEEKSTWLDAYYGNTKSGGGGRLVKEKEKEEEEEEEY